jgi:hypothetical protein
LHVFEEVVSSSQAESKMRDNRRRNEKYRFIMGLLDAS